MRFLLAAALLAALPSPALAARTSTAVRVTKPAVGDATVAGFELRLVKKKTATATASAVKLPKGVSVYAVVAKQKRSDRVRGVLVVVRRADAVKAGAAAATVLVNLRHAAIPSGYSTRLSVKQRPNVLAAGRPFRCLSWFRPSDLRNAVLLGGPELPGLSAPDAVAAACASARSHDPYPGENLFRQALNSPTGFLTFKVDAAVPTQLDGSVSFTYPVGAFTVLADKTHRFTACSFPGGSCRLMKKRHANDYAVFTLASPAAAGTPLGFVVGLAEAPKPALPFEFFGVSQGGKRNGPLLTSGP